MNMSLNNPFMRSRFQRFYHEAEFRVELTNAIGIIYVLGCNGGK
jgi:hypothetical protein